MDTSGWGNQFGAVYYQDAFNPHANYALSNFDRPNSFQSVTNLCDTAGEGTPIRELGPGGCGSRGWQLSTIIIAQSGAAVHGSYE